MLTSLLRHRMAVRALALGLVLLAASPLTAPFSTLDLVPLGPAAPAVDTGKTKGPQAVPVAVPAPALMARPVESLRTMRPAVDLQAAARPAQHTVLRL